MLNAKYIDELVKKAAEFGDGKIHIIVNNAGFTWDGVIHKMSDKQWDTIIALHNTAPFKLVRAAAPYFRVKDGEPRCIINISSTSGVNGNAYVTDMGGAISCKIYADSRIHKGSSQLWNGKGRCHRIFESHSQRVGSFIRRPRQYVCLSAFTCLLLFYQLADDCSVLHLATFSHV